MESINNRCETGSSPYYLNMDTTTSRDFTVREFTSPEFGLLETLNKFDLVEKPIIIEPQYFDTVVNTSKY